MKLVRNYIALLSVERERRLLDEKRVKWITRRMEMIGKETKARFQSEMGVEYRVNMQAVEKKPATKSPEEIEQLLCWEQYLMELLLLYEVKEWEQLFWNKLKAFLDGIGNDLVEVKERLTKEWRTNYPKRLNLQMDAAVKRLGESASLGERLGERWASSISHLFEGVEKPNSILLSELRKEMEPLDDEIRLRVEKEIEDTEFRLKRGSLTGRFDQFWDHDTLFECRYSRSKWLLLRPHSTIPLEIYSHALKGNKNIIHIYFNEIACSAVNRFQNMICDLPWVTSISCPWNDPNTYSKVYPQYPLFIHRSPLLIESPSKVLISFAEEIRPKLDPFSTYIFTDAGRYDMDSLPDRLGSALCDNARVLISFVAPISGQHLILRLKHSGSAYPPLEVTLGSTIIEINPSTKSSVTIDDITLYPIQDHGPSESDRLSFKPEIRNDIIIQYRHWRRGHVLHDIELLDEAGLKYPRNGIINVD